MSEESTTPDLVELTRRVHEPASRRDIDANIGFYAPNVLWDVGAVGTYEGVAAIRSFVEGWTPDFEWFPAMPATVEGGGYRHRRSSIRFGAEGVRGTVFSPSPLAGL